MEKVYLQLALDETKELVSIYDVPTGIDCKCTCPGCGIPLIAKNHNKLPNQPLLPQQKSAHFAHTGPECTWATESAIHMMAKEVLAEYKSFLIPDLHFKGKLLATRKLIQFDEVILEENVHKEEVKFIPDAIVFKNGRELYIEFYKTHAVDDLKIQKLQKLNKSCVEVNINNLEPLDNGKKNIGGVRRILEEDVISKIWLHNSQQQKLFEKFLAQEKPENPGKQQKDIVSNAAVSIEGDFLSGGNERTEEDWGKWDQKQKKNQKWKENLLKKGYKFMKVYPGRGDWRGFNFVYCPMTKVSGENLRIEKDSCENCVYFRCEIYGWKSGVYIACGFRNKIEYNGSK